MHVLLTGATGFVGQRLCRVLLQRGFAVRAIVRRPDAVLEAGGAQQVVVKSIETQPDWRAALRGIDTVIHLAGRAHVMREDGVDPLAGYRAVNVAGTVGLAQAAAAGGVRRLVYVSSIKVNGEATSDAPFRAGDRPAPVDAYGISKWEAEQALRQIARDPGMEVVVVRPPLVYGPGVKGNLLTLLRWIDRGLPLPLAGCHNRRSLVGLDNLVDLLLRCATEGAAAGQVFLAGDGEDMSTADLVRRMARALGRRPRLFAVPPALLKVAAWAAGQPGVYDRLCGSLQVDIGAARRLLGWTPPASIDEELARMAQWFRQQGGAA